MAHQTNYANAAGTEAQLTRAGQANAAGDARALYLKLFSGEMFKGFQNNTIARDLVMKRTLKNGKSLQFIFTGRTGAEYHTPGRSILGNSDGAPPVNEVTITCDNLLISSAFVYELDEVLAHYDLRAEISRKIGYALAEKYDRLIFRQVVKAARSASPITKSNFVEPGGSQIQVGANAADAYDAGKLVDAFYNAASMMDEKGVSGDGRVAVLTPRQYYKLIREAGDNALINRDARGDALQSGKGVAEIAGIKIYKSNNIPFQSAYGVKLNANGVPTKAAGRYGDFVGPDMELADATTTGGNDYGEAGTDGDDSGTTATSTFSTTCGLIFQKEAVGCVEAIAPQVQTTSGDVSVIYQGDVILGRLAMGADKLNPAAAVELHTGTAQDLTGWA